MRFFLVSLFPVSIGIPLSCFGPHDCPAAIVQMDQPLDVEVKSRDETTIRHSWISLALIRGLTHANHVTHVNHATHANHVTHVNHATHVNHVAAQVAVGRWQASRPAD
jgi:hypothetical protein